MFNLMANNLIEWVQSIDGIMGMTFGGVSLAAIIGVVWSTVKSVGNAKTLKEVMGALNTAKETIIKERSAREEVDKQNKILQAEKKIESAKTDYLLKSISLIIAASNGISGVDKISLINDGKKLMETIKTESEKTIEKVIEESAKTVEKVVIEKTQETVEEVQSYLDKYVKP